MGFFEEVYAVVRKIPKGKVTTYGHVAREIGTRDARRVGQALHANKDREVPCHRVVFADGSLAPGYAFGGLKEQRKRLEAEGVKFSGEKVDIKAGLWTGGGKD
jgi:methylated-DNA-protein-cysteine methyltransferase-like protein